MGIFRGSRKQDAGSDSASEEHLRVLAERMLGAAHECSVLLRTKQNRLACGAQLSGPLGSAKGRSHLGSDFPEKFSTLCSATFKWRASGRLSTNLMTA